MGLQSWSRLSMHAQSGREGEGEDGILGRRNGKSKGAEVGKQRPSSGNVSTLLFASQSSGRPGWTRDVGLHDRIPRAKRGTLGCLLLWFDSFWEEPSAKAFDCVDHNKLWKILKEIGIPDHLTCLLRNVYAVRKQQLELDMEQQTGSK